ncbi:MAG: DUF2069 domain-containing protein [Gallionellaceae bacterium]|nr:DUF2069 domain-containing protein [Gallionellaceae bacterium]
MPRLNAALLSAIASASLIALILLGLAWELWLAPLRPGGSWLVLKVLPLLALLFGVLHGRIYTYRWTSLVVWPYFAEGVMRLMTESRPAADLAAIEIALALVLFLSAALFIRTLPP